MDAFAWWALIRCRRCCCSLFVESTALTWETTGLAAASKVMLDVAVQRWLGVRWILGMSLSSSLQRTRLGSRYNSNRATQYGSAHFAQSRADIIIHGLTTGYNIHPGERIILGFGKPNTPADQCSSVRPVVLLKRICKATSHEVLKRISSKAEKFLSPHQSGFKPWPCGCTGG